MEGPSPVPVQASLSPAIGKQSHHDSSGICAAGPVGNDGKKTSADVAAIGFARKKTTSFIFDDAETTHPCVDVATLLEAHVAKWHVLQEDVQAWITGQERLCGLWLSAKGSPADHQTRLSAQQALMERSPSRMTSQTSRRGISGAHHMADICDEQSEIHTNLMQRDSTEGSEPSRATPSPRRLSVQSQRLRGDEPPSPISVRRMSDASSVFAMPRTRSRIDLESDLAKMEKQRDWAQVSFAKIAGRFDDFLEKYGNEVPRDTRLRKMVFSAAFEWTTLFVILANALVMVLSTDHAIDNPTDPDHSVFNAFEMCFTLYYIVEIFMRVTASGWSFLFSEDWRWNIVDVLLVVTAIWDQIQIMLAGSDDEVNISFIRITRLLKITRLLRTVRIFKMFRELRLIISSMFGCARTMVWSVVLILLTTCIFGLCFTQAGSSYLQDEAGERPGLDARIMEYFGSTSRSMLTLYMAASNGDSWRKFDETLQEIGALYHVIFLIYIAFFMLTVANTMTALFIESTQMLAEKDDHTIVREELSRRKKFITKLKELWAHLDTDGSGMIRMEDAEQCLQTKEMVSFANSLGLDPLDMEEFFILLSDGGRKPVDAETFIMGCFKLKGHARSLELVSLMHLVKDLHARHGEEQAGTEELLQRIDKLLVKIDRRLCPPVHAVPHSHHHSPPEIVEGGNGFKYFGI